MNSQPFEVLEKEKKICELFGVPLPTLSPTERFRLLMAFRNEWKLYQRKCDATGEDILSAYTPNVPFPVYKNEIWWGDTWDAIQYGRDYDFKQSFFTQFKDLQKVVPREGTSIFRSENCDYNSHIRESRNCYLNSLVAKCEDAYFSYWIVGDKDVFDSVVTNNSTLCYNCSDVNDCYQCFTVQESNNCSECYFSYQLRGCKNCIFSSNLVNKSYYIFNKQVGKEDFEKMKTKILDGSYKTWHRAYQEFLKMRKQAIHRNLQMLQCENALGDHIYNCRNCYNCFESFGSEDCYNSISSADSKDIHSSYSAGWQSCELVYFSVVSRGCTQIAFCSYTWFSQNMYYCDSCVSCSDCFGCIGLRHKKYCILNKQYTKEEYETLFAKIKANMQKEGAWGQFFPPSISVFGYNETAAGDFFPLSKEEAIKRGFNWCDYESPRPKVKAVIQAADLPDKIQDVKDDILNMAIECEIGGKPFKIIKPELKFYRENNLPLPRRAPYQRHLDRMTMRNPHLMWDKNCAKCGTQMKTSFGTEATETIYCEKCYLESLN